MVIGKLFVKNLITKVLFDLRATHSFISTSLASRIKKPKKDLIELLLVSTPLGKLLPARKEMNICKIKIGENTTEIDLVILDL